VVRKAIHEVRRHLVEYMTTFGRKPDEIYIELEQTGPITPLLTTTSTKAPIPRPTTTAPPGAATSSASCPATVQRSPKATG